MPHKRKRRLRDEADFELPPDTVARPLSASKSSAGIGGRAADKPSRKKLKVQDNDTPKEFLRLMNRMNGRTTSELSQSRNGHKRRKLGRVENAASAETMSSTTEIKEKPSILPGERMADFSARVDQALPLNGLVTKGKVDVPGVKRHRTKLERKITRMQDEWREQERRNKEKLAEAEEDEEIEAILNGDAKGRTFRILDEEGQETSEGKKGRKGKRKGRNKKQDRRNSDDDDPWAVLASSRRAEQQGSGLVGIHDVVQAPPRFDVQPKERFKVHDGARVKVSNVPNAAGSLRLREELEKTRGKVLQDYRMKMKTSRQ